MIRQEPKTYNPIDFEDWYHDRLEEKLGLPYYTPGDLDQLYLKYELISEKDYKKIKDTLNDAFNKARKMNYEIFTRKLATELEKSPDPQEKIKLEREDAESLLDKYKQAYKDFLGGKNVIKPFEGSCCDYVLKQYMEFQRSDNTKKQSFEPIINITYSYPKLGLNGSSGPNPLSPSLEAPDPDKQNAILFVASYHDFKEYLASITKSNGKAYNASTCALILYYLQTKNPKTFRPGVSQDLVRSQLNEVGILSTSYYGTDNSGTVRNKLHGIQKGHDNNPTTKQGAIAKAIEFFKDKGYDNEKELAKKDFGDLPAGQIPE